MRSQCPGPEKEGVAWEGRRETGGEIELKTKAGFWGWQQQRGRDVLQGVLSPPGGRRSHKLLGGRQQEIRTRRRF